MNVVRVVALLMVSKLQNIFVDEIVAVVADKLHTPTNHILNQIDCEKEFHTALGTAQVNHTQWLQSLSASSSTFLQSLKAAITKLDKMMNALGTSHLDPTNLIPANAINHITSIAELAKMLTKMAEELKVNAAAMSANHPTTHTSTPTTYTSVAPTNLATFNPNTPEYITCIENKLCIQDRQLYITFNQSTEDSPKDLGSAAAYKLCSKMNEWMCSLDQEINQVLHTASHLIKTLHFESWSTTLIECNSNTLPDHLKVYLKDKNLLTHICSTVKIQPHTYQLVMRFIPCDGVFSPHNETHLCSLEEVHGIEEGSIISAAWIKKPEMWFPKDS